VPDATPRKEIRTARGFTIGLERCGFLWLAGNGPLKNERNKINALAVKPLFYR
jgi:hypothetical protein